MITSFTKSLKVCLYYSHYEGEQFNVRPLGISYLAAYLLHKGIVLADNLRIVDDYAEVIVFKPDILGISSVSQVITDACEFARKCKEATGCFTLLGGYHVSAIPQHLPDVFDVGVIGEGEETFVEIVEKYAKHPLREPDFKDIFGICYRDERGLIHQTPLRKHISDIDAIPLPLRYKPYYKHEPIFTSRGCPFRCTFCASQGFWRGDTRFRSADSVVSEIVQVVDRYQPDEIAILDDLWMADKKRFKNIVRQLVNLGIPEKVSFRGFCRSNIIDEEDILLLKEMNYRFVRFGAETGSDSLLKRIKGQNISVDDHQRVIDLCRKHGLMCGASFMFGVPGETESDLQETIDFLRKNKECFKIIGFYLFNPIPGTVLWSELESKGAVSGNFEFDRLQLDLLKSDFSWDDVLYFNSENVPLETFRIIVTIIRDEFIDGAVKKPTGRLKTFKRYLNWPWRAILHPILRSCALFVGYRRSKRVVSTGRLRVLVAGGYGYGNVGDEAQLAANLQHWKKASPGCRLTVLTPNCEYTDSVHSQIRVELAPRKSLFGLGGSEYFGSEKKFKVMYPLIATICLFNACLVRAGFPIFGLTSSQARLLNELNDSDVLFLSGGGYLTGMTLTRLWDNMLLICLAYALGVPTILSGQTIGVFKDPISRILARWGLKKAELIYLRDPVDSAKDLSTLGLSGDWIKSTFDDALFFESASTCKITELLEDSGINAQKPYIAVNVHYWGQEQGISRVIMGNIARALDRICKDTGLQIVFIPMVRSDEAAIEEVRAAMDEPGTMPAHGYRPDLTVGLIQNAALCMTMKHHPIIFAMAAAVPTVSMTFDDYYYHKNYGAMKIFHQEDYLLKSVPEELEQQLYDRTKAVFDKREEISVCIAGVVEKLRPMAGEAIQKFMEKQ
nr:polysaccharide pyruvyl transferase family protein [Desulfobulbaceae bacterium]